MAFTIGGKQYVPGMYLKRKLKGEQLAEKYFSDLKARYIEKQKEKDLPEFFPCICLSRKIGVGAVEVADIIGRVKEYPVMDREILVYIAQQTKLSEKAVAYFDERYPGRMDEFLKYLFTDKSFINSDYSRHLFSTVISLAGLESTIFVGRGTHLILPRDRILSVRCICSDNFRAKRLARILEVNESDAAAQLRTIDKEQQGFFNRVYGKKKAAKHEFDLILNFDYLSDPEAVAKIIISAFEEKFKAEL